MRTTFSGIYIALRALQAQQTSLDITGHNVANANNPHYSRQVALHSATRPFPTPVMGYTPSNGQVGTGVEISQIVRMRDAFVDMRLRQQLQSRNYWATLEEGLRQVELFFNEPSENSIHYALDQLWDSLQDLSRDPELLAVREVVVQRAQVLVEAIRGTRGQLQRLRENLNDNIPVKVNEVNILGQRLAALNVEIGKVSATGSMPNDLLDQRDALLEELSKLVDIEVIQDHANMVSVTIGGASLVHRGTAYALGISEVPDSDADYTRHDIIWAATGSPAQVQYGEIGGMLDLRDRELDQIIDSLDAWTQQFVDVFNKIHGMGYDLFDNKAVETVGDFFVVVGNKSAANISVNPLLLEGFTDTDGEFVPGASLIRASDKEGVAGNGAIALWLAQLRFGTRHPDNPDVIEKPSLGDQYTALISSVGVKAQEAIRMTENQVVLENHLQNLKESISGVSLDEEMANMIRFQHAYNAAARMMTAVDETLDTIINRLGIVGR